MNCFSNACVYVKRLYRSIGFKCISVSNRAVTELRISKDLILVVLLVATEYCISFNNNILFKHVELASFIDQRTYVDSKKNCVQF